jgi:hypothetical protein
MQKKPIFNFKQFSGIFEDDEDQGQSGPQLKSIDIVMNIFFEIYGTIVTRIGGYKEGVKDYQAIANSENDKRGDLMVAAIDKISRLVLEKKPDLKSALDEYKKSTLLLKQAYDKILLEDKNQLLNIKKKIKDMIIEYLNILVSDIRSTKLPEVEKKNESLEYLGDLLLEKDLYQKERKTVIRSILPLKAKASDLSNKSIFPEIKSSAKNALRLYDRIIKTLQDDDFFDKKKRPERAEEIEKSRFDIISTENSLNKTLSEITIKYGIAKEIDAILKKCLSALNSANEMLKEAEKKRADKEEINKIEDSESEKKAKDKFLESYGWKSIKDAEDKKVYYKKEDWDDSKKAGDQKNQIAVGKVVKGSIDETKKEIKIYNETAKKTFTKSFSDILDKEEGDKNSTEKISDEKEKKEGKEKEYKEIKAGDKNPEEVKEVQKKLNKILPKDLKSEEDGKYEGDMKKSLSKAIQIMKSLGVVKKDYKEDTSKITVELQKYLDEYIDKLDQIKNDISEA